LYLYESGHISMMTLGVIEESVDVAIEAANRHCQELDHLKNSGDPVLKNIHKDKGRQTEMSIAVFWEHLEHYLYDCWDERGVYSWGFCPGCMGKQGSFMFEWSILQNDAELVVGALLAFDHVVDNQHAMLSDFPAVLKGIHAMQAQVKRRILAPIYERSPKLFNLWMHLFAARRILSSKKHAVHHMLHEGNISNADAELVEPVLEMFTNQRSGYLVPPFSVYMPTEKAMTGGKETFAEVIESIKAKRKEIKDTHLGKNIPERRSTYYSMFPESEGLIPVAKSGSTAPAGTTFAPEESK